MTDINDYLQSLKTKLEISVVEFQDKYNTLPQLEVQILANINQILDASGGSGGGTGITEAQVTSAIENADLSAIASQATLDEILDQLEARLQIKAANTLPVASDPALVVTTRDNINTSKSIVITGSGINNDEIIISSTDISEYSIVSFQLTGNWQGLVIIEGSNNNSNWSPCTSNKVDNLFENATYYVGTPGIYNITKQTKYIRASIGYTTGVVGATLYLSNISGYSNPLKFPDQITVNTELPEASSLTDTSLQSSMTAPCVGSVGLLVNDSTTALVRWRACKDTSGEGRGRAKVSNSTEGVTLSPQLGISSPVTTNPVNLGCIYKDLSFQIDITNGTVSQLNVTIQGSINNSVYMDIASTTSIVNGYIFVSLNMPVQYVRAIVNVINGTTPRISIYCGAC